MELRPFQRRFIRRALSPEIDTAAISLPRAGGKTFLCARIVSKALTPSDPTYECGREVVLVSGSLQQARFAYRFIKEELEQQLLASLGDLMPGQDGGETAPLSKEETEGEFRTIEIAIPIADLVPIETAAALRGVDPAILIGEALARGMADHRGFLKENPDLDETEH